MHAFSHALAGLQIWAHARGRVQLHVWPYRRGVAGRHSMLSTCATSLLARSQRLRAVTTSFRKHGGVLLCPTRRVLHARCYSLPSCLAGSWRFTGNRGADREQRLISRRMTFPSLLKASYRWLSGWATAHKREPGLRDDWSGVRAPQGDVLCHRE